MGSGGPDDNDAQGGRLVAFHATQDPISSQDYVPAIGHEANAIQSGTMVRRLTPRECERLQGFPDDWTQLGDTPDSRRYSALGDAVTVNVSEWIGKRLMQHLRAVGEAVA